MKNCTKFVPRFSTEKKWKVNNCHCPLDLFDKSVVPILLYSCAIWDFESYWTDPYLKQFNTFSIWKGGSTLKCTVNEKNVFLLFDKVCTRMVFLDKATLKPIKIR